MSTESPHGACVVCGSDEGLREVPGFSSLPRITSDCRPFAAGGYLAVCAACSAVQKRVDSTWLREIGEIYSVYAAYYQSGGDEQIVFDRHSGRPRRRSDVLTERLAAGQAWPASARVLDVGCGNGATLTAMSQQFPDWALHGFEIGDGALPRLQAIAGFRRLYTGDLAAIDARFDLVSMVHAIEHFPAPVDTLRTLRHTVGEGQLFIQVCNVEENPFDILVADHLVHFSPASLSRLLTRAGFAPTQVATDWVAKEISLLARPSADASPGSAQAEPAAAVHARISQYVSWLGALVDKAQTLALQPGGFGLFGTSIAATWLADQLGERLQFFVDEDTSRIGKQHMGRPILSPADAPQGSTILLALAPRVATSIAGRLSLPQARLVMPPE